MSSGTNQMPSSDGPGGESQQSIGMYSVLLANALLHCRWEVWKACLQCRKRRVNGLYGKLSQAENQWTNLIHIDVPRTFAHALQIPPSTLESLGRILNAYANLNPEVGYCQGMNFLVGLTLRVMSPSAQFITPDDEEEVFWLLVCLMDYDSLRDFYKEGFPLLMKYTIAFYELMREEIPDLYAHFEKEGISPSLFLHQWYLSLFINCLPFPTVLILWDSIICDGLPVVLSLSISLLKVLRNVLIKMEFEQIIKFFKTMKNGDEECDAKIIGQLLVKQACLISIPKHVLRSLSAPVAVASPPRNIPWSMPVIPLFDGESSPSALGPNSPSLFERVSSAFSWNSYNSDDNS